MRELVRYVFDEFRRGDSIPLTLVWLLALAGSSATRKVELERWREAANVSVP